MFLLLLFSYDNGVYISDTYHHVSRIKQRDGIEIAAIRKKEHKKHGFKANISTPNYLILCFSIKTKVTLKEGLIDDGLSFPTPN
ncbi:hypothetical protein CR513_35440, partial [Mucuna pruriens]